MKKHIIIIHEIHGVTPSLLDLKKYLQSFGYSVSLPSLYEDHYIGTNEAVSYSKFYGEVGLEKSCKIISKRVQRHTNSEIILIGFSVGATVAWLHSTDIRVTKIIGIYGSKIRDFLDIKPIVETKLLFCNEKTFDVRKVHEILNDKDHVSSEIIEGMHGFYNDKDKNKQLIEKTNQTIISFIDAPNL